jgi:hypothetical protein
MESLCLADRIRAISIITGALSLIQSNGGDRRNWYVGIAWNPESRLADGHGIQLHSMFLDGDVYKYWDAGTEMLARWIERDLVEKYGFDGGSGGGGVIPPTYVYVFLQNDHTRR